MDPVTPLWDEQNSQFFRLDVSNRLLGALAFSVLALSLLQITPQSNG